MDARVKPGHDGWLHWSHRFLLICTLAGTNEATLKKLIVKTLIRRMGSSLGIIIPKALLAEIGARAGDKVDIRWRAARSLWRS